MYLSWVCIQGFSSIIVVTPPDSDTQVKDVEEELDYDENMDDIDVHVYRPEDLDVEEKDNEKNTDQSISSGEFCLRVFFCVLCCTMLQHYFQL